VFCETCAQAVLKLKIWIDKNCHS